MDPRRPSPPIVALTPLPLEGWIVLGLSLGLGLVYAFAGLAP